MGGEVVYHGMTTGEWISAIGIVVVIVLQLLKWASDKGEARAMRAAMKEQMCELKDQIKELWRHSDQHATDIAYFKGKIGSGNGGLASRVVDEESVA